MVENKNKKLNKKKTFLKVYFRYREKYFEKENIY